MALCALQQRLVRQRDRGKRRQTALAACQETKLSVSRPMNIMFRVSYLQRKNKTIRRSLRCPSICLSVCSSVFLSDSSHEPKLRYYRYKYYDPPERSQGSKISGNGTFKGTLGLIWKRVSIYAFCTLPKLIIAGYLIFTLHAGFFTMFYLIAKHSYITTNVQSFEIKNIQAWDSNIAFSLKEALFCNFLNVYLGFITIMLVINALKNFL